MRHPLHILNVTIISFIFLLVLIPAHAQSQPPFFIPVPLICDTVDSITVYANQPVWNKNFPDFVSYQDPEGAMVAFRIENSNQWLATLMPFFEPTSDIQRMQIDGKGDADWIIRGNTREYGSGGGTGTSSVIVISMGKQPLELFTADYMCWEEQFGDHATGDTSGMYVHSYGFNLSFSKGTIHVTKLRQTSEEWCVLSPLHPGIYQWTDKGFRIPGVLPHYKVKHHKTVHSHKKKTMHRKKSRHHAPAKRKR